MAKEKSRDDAARDRFTMPFSSYIVKADGAIVWLVEGLTDEQKERILARSGRSSGSKVDDEIVNDDNDDEGSKEEDPWLSDVEGPKLSHEHLGVSVYDRAGGPVYYVLLALSASLRPPAEYADAVADAIDFANVEAERHHAENQRYMGELMRCEGSAQRFTDEAERHAAEAKRHRADADSYFMKADRLSGYEEEIDEAERCFDEYLSLADKALRCTGEELRCRREALNCRDEEHRYRREALRYDDLAARWSKAANCLTKDAKRPRGAGEIAPDSP